MEKFCIKKVGVDAGLIMVCDFKYYDEWGNKTDFGKNSYSIVCSQKIKVKPGTYKVKWLIEDTWNGDITGEGIVKTDSGIIVISDPCYCIETWGEWLENTNMGKNVDDDVILIDEMGGDGEYEVNLELTKIINKEKKVSKDKFDAYSVVRDSGMTNMMNIKQVIIYAKDYCDVPLTKEDCFYIMKNYVKLKEEYQ